MNFQDISKFQLSKQAMGDFGKWRNAVLFKFDSKTVKFSCKILQKQH
jgi:hypothetical protein